jgi:hypothetical protein
MTYFVGISGKIGAGKDYLAGKLIEELEKRGLDATHASFAFPLKNELNSIMRDIVAGVCVEALAAKYSIPLAQMQVIHGYIAEELAVNPDLDAYDRTPGIRSALQFLGTEVRRAVDTDYWVHLFHENVAQDDRERAFATFATDARFPNEADSIRETGGFMIRLEVPAEIILDRTKNRDGIQYTQEQLNHPSETALDDYPDFDLIVGHEFDAAEIVDALIAWQRTR